MKRLAGAVEAEAEPEFSDAQPLGAVIDETDDAGGHRIYFDPWAGEREAGEAEEAEEVREAGEAGEAGETVSEAGEDRAG